MRQFDIRTSPVTFDGSIMNNWEMIRQERTSLVDGLAALSPADFDHPSLCGGWTVRDVVAHIVATANMTPPKFIAELVGSGFNFQKLTSNNIRRYGAGKTSAELIDGVRARIDARTAPPGPTASWLGETIVHGEDIFRALGTYREHPIANVLAAADFYKTSNLLIGAKNRIDGVTLQANDTDWRHGTGPEATGPAIALLMAMTGRKTALDDLSGDGVALLRDRN
jgi:uncharacterized protein (TIGR03083 family)